MAQAKTLSQVELERVLEHIDCNRYALRNRAMMQLTHFGGGRIGEVACLRWSDVVDNAGKIREEIRLLPAMTKVRHARTVFVRMKLREELQAHADSARCIDRSISTTAAYFYSGPAQLRAAVELVCFTVRILLGSRQYNDLKQAKAEVGLEAASGYALRGAFFGILDSR